MQSLIGFISSSLHFAYNSANAKISHATINPLTAENATYLIKNNDSINANIASVLNQVEPTELAFKGVFVVISL